MKKIKNINISTSTGTLVLALVIVISAVTIGISTNFKLSKSAVDNPCLTQYKPGDAVMLEGVEGSARYIFDNNMELMYDYNGAYRAWEPNYDSVKTISKACYFSIPTPAGKSGLTYPPGTYLVKHIHDDQLYAILPGDKLAKISEDIAKKLYGVKKDGNVRYAGVHWHSWANYVGGRAADITVAKPHAGMLLNINGIRYYTYPDGDSVKLREVTATGNTANKFQSRFTYKTDPSVVSGMEFGSIIDGPIDAILDKTQATAYPVDTGTPKPMPVAPVLSMKSQVKSAELSWTKYDGSNYKYARVVRSETNTTPAYPGTDLVRFLARDANITSFTDTRVTLSKTYYYSVCVQTTIATHLCSNSVKVTIAAEVPPPTPSTLSGSLTSDGISLGWTKYSGTGFKSYHLVRSTTNASPKYPTDTTIKVSTDINLISYLDTNTVNSTKYYYSLCSEQTTDKVACSNVVTITTPTPPPPPPPPSYGTTYYIRTDGGTYTQCDGKTNVAYSASITDKKCAVNHPFQLFPPGGSARISGGDTVMIANGSYKMGSGAPGATNDDKCNQAWSYECVMAKIPSGPDKDKPTKILGAGYNSGCATKPELWGSGRPWAIIDMNGSSNVEVQCLEITDHSQCVEFHSGGNSCERSNAPFGDWASIGLRASDSRNVLLKNLDIHGLAHTGVYAGRLTDWTIESTKIEGNGWVGWDGDIDGSDANTGTMTFKKVNVDWNGCGQTYPGRQPIGCWGQSAGGYGDGLGTGATGGDWIFEDSTFLHNTSDGLDMLYHRNGGKITVNRVHAEGNAGNQLKTNGNAQITDSVIVGNCAYFQGKSFTHNVDACRALGNALSLGGTGATTPILVYNNSIYSEGDGLLLAEGSATIKIRNNIFYAGTDYHQNFEKSFYLYSEGAITFDQDYNLVYQAKDNDDYCQAGTHNICSTDPKFTSVGSTFNLKLQSTSPAIDKGTTGITSVDFLGGRRPQGESVDMGAYEIK